MLSVFKGKESKTLIDQCQAELTPLEVEELVKRYKSERARNRWLPIYEGLIADAESLAEPAVICREFALEEVVELSEWLPGQTVSVVLAVTTLGRTLDDYVNGMTNTDLVSAVILNEITLAMITALTRSLHANIRSETLTRGLKAGAAYRPGVGRWPIFTQEVVFKLVPTQEIGVTLDESLTMWPVKSTSLIIPILDKKLPI